MNKIFLLLILLSFAVSCNSSVPSKKVETPNIITVSKTENEIQIILNSNDQMQFDKKVLSASPGQKVTLTLNHTGRGNKMIMGHNFVLLKKDVDVDIFARKAVEARDNEYIPEGDEIIAYTKLLGGGDTDTITFDAPKKGIYTFICTFPGHWQLMKGKFIVK